VHRHPLDAVSLVLGVLFAGLGVVLLAEPDLSSLDPAWVLVAAGLGGGLLVLGGLWTRRR
jgi:hypothetical protein